MKSFRSLFLIPLLFGIMACNKSNNQKPIPPVNTNPSLTTTDDAAGLATSSLAVNSNGVVNVIGDFTIDAQTRVHLDSLCGTTWTDSVTRKSQAGAKTTYSYFYKYSFALTCTGTSPNFSGTATTTSVYNGSFNSPSFSSSNSGSSDFTLAGLGKDSTSYDLNGEYKRSGSFQSKKDTSFAGSSNIDIVITNLKASKPFRIIESGSATINISGSSPKKGSFSYTGTIVFNNDNTATLTLNGTAYIIDLIGGNWRRR